MADQQKNHQFGQQELQQQLPGFRFHPTEEELLDFYLKQMVFAKRRHSFHDVIQFLNIYQHDPWDLPALAKNGEREWYFFVPRDRKHGGCGGGRPNRTTGIGYWKATGSDRRIWSLSEPKRLIGLRKTLVFYKGRAPRGTKTDWVMNEYRLPQNYSLPTDIVICKIYRKATSLKVLEQRAEEEETKKLQMNYNNSLILTHEEQPQGEDDLSFCTQIPRLNSSEEVEIMVQVMKKETSFGQDQEEEELEEEEEEVDSKVVTAVGGSSSLSSTSLQIPKAFEMLTDLQVPKMNMDWTQDQFWSPWFLNLIATDPRNVLNL